MSMTIRELAEGLGVSKTAVRKHMSEDFREKHTKTENGIIIIDDEGCKLVAENLRKPLQTPQTNAGKIAETSENTANGISDNVLKVLQDTISTLQEQLKVKDSQIEAQQTQIAQLTEALQNTTNSLTAAQALHAGSLKQLMDGSESTADKDEPEKKGLFRRMFGK